MQKSDRSESLIFSFLLILAMACWGGAWPAAKLIGTAVSVQTVVFYRFIIAAIALFPVVLIYRQKFTLDRRQFLWILLGAVIFTGYNELFFTGIKLGLSGAGGVLVTTTNPIFTYLLTMLIFRYRPGWKSGLGLFLGLLGGGLMLRLWTFDGSEIFRLGNGIFLISSVFWAGVTIISGYTQRMVHFSSFTFYFYLFSAVLSLPFSLIRGDTLLVFSQPFLFWANLIYLAIFAMAFAATIFFLASNRLGSHRASHFVYLIPVFAVFFSFLLVDEVPKWNSLTGGGLALAAVYILNRMRS